jgi:hypothetical protein
MMFVTYALLYLLIGAGFAIYMPISRADAQHKLEHHVSAEKWATLTLKERQFIMASLGPTSSPYTTTQLVIGGLLWPLQLLIVIVGEVYLFFYRRRSR